jgi:hypothetical protein
MLKFLSFRKFSSYYQSSATNRLIDSADHAAVQINIPHVDANGAIIPGEV